jgi:hypothetical protein
MKTVFWFAAKQRFGTNKPEYLEKTTDLSQVTEKLYHIMLYRAYLACARFEFGAIVMIGTDCIGCYKSNYHAIAATTAYTFLKVMENIVWLSQCSLLVYT